jgi:hypothetical protein
MKAKNLPQSIILIIAFCTIYQFANAQTSCSADKVLMSKGYYDCCGHHGNQCRTKCVDSSQVQSQLNHGWYIGACHVNMACCCCERLSEDQINTLRYDLAVYPNPLFDYAFISFFTESTEAVSMKIFDVSGRLISTLADHIFEEGDHEVKWNAADVNAGIYFLRFQTKGFLKTEKLIVTK